MEIEEVTDKEYSNIIPKPYHIFGSSVFASLNINKAEKVFYLLFKDTKFRLGLIGGKKNNSFYTPFSAPCGGLNFLDNDVKISFIDNAILALSEWAKKKHLNTINFTLPPDIYDESFIAKQINSLFRNGFIINKVELNHSFDLENFNDGNIQNMWHNARKNLRIAINNDSIFKKCTTLSENKLAYEIIKTNRRLRGKPLHMSWAEIEATSTIIKADFFLVYNTGIPIASAIIFHVAHSIVQVIYWGDLPEFNRLKTMNYLSYKVFEYYKLADMRVVDIGISTENSIPNHGLCEFKESIGCQVQKKISFTKSLD